MPYFPPSGGGSTLTTPVSIANGGTGSSTQNFVDLTNTQTVNGTKTLQTSSPSSKGLIVKGSTSTGSSPATITTNLALWLKADAITGTSSGGSLATWLDSSAAGNNATQATSGTQPTYITNQINGYPIVRFNGAQNMAISLAALVSSSYTIIVVEARAASGTQYLLGSNSNTPYSVMNENIQFGYRAGTTFTLAQYSNDLNATISDYSTKTFNIDEGTLDTSVGHTIYQNGTSIASNSNVTPATVLNAPEIGGAAGGGAFNGDIAEIIIYSTILTTAQRQNIEMYLGNKYGITTAAASSQSVDLQEWQSPTSGVLSAIDQNGNHIPGTTNTVSMGNSTTYWLANYATTHYFNSTSYISGATAGTAALTGNLTVSGATTTFGSSGTAPTLTTAASSIMIGQTGSSNGATTLTIENGTGTNGAVFANAGLNLIDFILAPQTIAATNLRFEGRSVYWVDSGNTGGELQFGPPSVSGGSGSNVNIGINSTTFKKYVGVGLGASTAPTAFMHLAASSTSGASLRIASGAAPTSPNSGDVWFDGTHLQFRNGSTTYQLDQQSGGSGSGVTTVGTFSSTSEVNGAAISSSTITFGPADGTNPGMVTTGAQTFAGAKTFTSQISASAGIYVAPSYNIALDSAASIVFSVNNTSTIGTPTSYAQYMYGSRYYLNSTAYIDGGTAGTVLITGGTGVNTALAVQASNAAGQTNFILSNTAASATTNSAVFELTNLTSTGQRTTFQFNASFSNVTDASRTSLITMQGASAGTFGNVMQFAGLIPTLYGQLTVPGISLTAPLVANATSISTDTTTGLIIGTATTQKLGFFNATPVVQQSATNDLGTTLSNLGFRASGTAYPITTSGGVILSGGLTSSAGSALTGNVRYNSQINTTSQTITTSQPMFQIGNSTSAITLTLPATTTVGYAYTLTNINTGLVTVVATINGATNYVLSQWQSITVFSTSTSGSWYSANNLATYSAQTNISANYTVLPNDSNIFATGTITVTLPSAVVFGGREITIYNVGTGTITVAATAGTVSIASIAAAGGAPANNSVAYVSNGTNWYTA